MITTTLDKQTANTKTYIRLYIEAISIAKALKMDRLLAGGGGEGGREVSQAPMSQKHTNRKQRRKIKTQMKHYASLMHTKP